MNGTNKITTLIFARLDELLDERRVVVWYDPKRECADLFEAYARTDLVKVDARSSTLAARRQADATWPALVDPATPPPRSPSMLIYVPWARASAESEVMHEPFEGYALAGTTFGFNPGESLQSLARSAPPGRTFEIDKLYSGPGTVSLAQLEALGDRAGFPLLKKALGTEDPVEVWRPDPRRSSRPRSGTSRGGRPFGSRAAARGDVRVHGAQRHQPTARTVRALGAVLGVCL